MFFIDVSSFSATLIALGISLFDFGSNVDGQRGKM